MLELESICRGSTRYRSLDESGAAMFDAGPVARLTFHVKVRGDVGTRLMSVTWLFLDQCLEPCALLILYWLNE